MTSERRVGSADRRLSTARAFARRMAVHKASSSTLKALALLPPSVYTNPANAFNVHAADGPRPPDVSKTIGMKEKPFRAQSCAVSRCPRFRSSYRSAAAQGRREALCKASAL